MDDVWSLDGNWWSRIYEGLPKGNGSSVIITTRLVKVLRKMEEVEVSAQNPELEKIGKEIVQKCNGLPLAIKAIGGMLLYKSHYHEWKRIADNFRDELGENDDTVMPSLQLSYDELPPYLKSCFLSFSLYPEDCVITKEQLVHWWIGEGFVPLRSGRPSTEAGEDLFLRVNKSMSGRSC
ncbi:DISEASE RESISTANCE RPP13-LIKE PROTEIN 4 [Salix koriyanagi]|uniref:DISEASE RESISTANCE RPP13-LIKE PROTEIN 4 n=1 Tax=Salix koriyanagi TaxID=2511006 RepID=A0A9Q0P5S0_9ROSI|nr:DISEASE RESISTANCE RPP13-LIKE PROTEIN 4 [Salix koriyanagi]